MKVGMGAVYRIKKNGVDVAEVKNLLTDGFFTRLFNVGTQQVGSQCALFLGTGTTAVSTSDTGMETNFVGSGVLQNNQGTELPTMTDTIERATINGKTYGFFSWDHTFSAGTFSGQNITEIGARFSDNSSSNQNTSTVIDSHALISDTNGNLLTLNLQASDSLSISVTFYWEFPDDYKGSVVINGVPYGYTTSALQCRQDQCTRNWCPLYRINNVNSWFWLALGTPINTLYQCTSTDYGLPSITSYPTLESSGGTCTFGTPTYSVPNRTVTLPVTVVVSSAVKSSGLRHIFLWCLTTNGIDNYISWHVRFDSAVTNLTGSSITFEIKLFLGEQGTIQDQTPLSVQANQSTITETVANGLSTTVQRHHVFPIGGVAPYTYSWTYQSGGSALLSADTPTARETTFSGTGTSQSSNEVWRCTVTDSDSNTATVDVNANVTWA